MIHTALGYWVLVYGCVHSLICASIRRGSRDDRGFGGSSRTIGVIAVAPLFLVSLACAYLLCLSVRQDDKVCLQNHELIDAQRQGPDLRQREVLAGHFTWGERNYRTPLPSPQRNVSLSGVRSVFR